MITLIQKAENTADSASTIVISYGSNVVAGNVLTVEVSRWTAGNSDPIVVGDLTQSAGSATIGTIALDRTVENSTTVTAIFSVAIFSVPVSGAGSLTFTVTGLAANYWWVNVSEWSGISSTAEASNGATGTSTAADSGNASSAGGALFVALAGTNQTTLKTYTEDVSFTLLNKEENGGLHQTGASAYRDVVTGTTDSASWTLEASVDWGAVVVVFSATGGTPITGLRPAICL